MREKKESIELSISTFYLHELSRNKILEKEDFLT